VWHLAPAHCDLAGFEFADSTANKALVRIRHHCEFIDKTENIVLISGSGTGDTYIGIGVQITAETSYNRPENHLE
jgi:DNA replication protein DnaC